MNDSDRRFWAVVEPGPPAGAFVRLPIAPAEAWGDRDRYHMTGKLSWFAIRAALVQHDGGFVLPVSQSWLDGCTVEPGMRVEVTLRPEGVKLDDLDPDIAEALALHPDAARFFESLAQFYRKAYLKWLDGAKRRSEVRKGRVHELVALLKAGYKQRPRG